MKNRHIVAQARRKGITQREVVNRHWVSNYLQAEVLKLLTAEPVPANEEGARVIHECMERALDRVAASFQIPAYRLLGKTVTLDLKMLRSDEEPGA